MPLEIIARCKKCGREFITLGTDARMIDAYGDPNWRPPKGRVHLLKANEWPTCGGDIELTEEHAKRELAS